MVVRIDDPRRFRTDPVTGEVYQVLSYIDENGQEVPDPEPLVLPIDIATHRTLADIVRDAVRGEMLAQEAREAGFETFDEADDLSVEDDPSSFDTERTQYERFYDPQPPVAAAPAAGGPPEGGGAAAPPSSPDPKNAESSGDKSRASSGASGT